ncbi:MAG: tetratricopeptide repeat protein [Myxococcales bacterium]|nr:tetratricopeptide repeat protein [Myxococcales bacterium]MCB9567522.1 tetratricopeptide repeat protein [Myxococcales bacterium]MCB9700607.1 tetratricopeptide repeat protein [Myxococcales bacterium]
MKEALDAVIRRGLDAIDAEDLGAAQEALDEASRLAGENHVQVLHLAGMLAWAEGRIDNAAGYLMQAVDLGSDRAEIYLDCAECLFIHGDDLDEAEAVVRSLLERDDIDEGASNEAKLLLAQIRLDDDDPDESLELLHEVSPEMQKHPAYLSTYGAVLMSLGRNDDATAALSEAVAQAPEDPDLHYQLGLTREAAGDREGAAAAMLKVLELDAAGSGDDEENALTPEEAADLITRFEEVLEEIPDPVLRLIASAPVSVQERPTPDQVRAGVNPRGVVAFVGQAKLGDDDEANLEGIVIMRDLMLESIDDDDEIPEVFIVGLLEEIRRFFREDSLGMASVGE